MTTTTKTMILAGVIGLTAAIPLRGRIRHTLPALPTLPTIHQPRVYWGALRRSLSASREAWQTYDQRQAEAAAHDQ